MKCIEIQEFAIVEQQKSVKMEEREKESDHCFINKVMVAVELFRQ